MITTKTCSTCEHFPNDKHCIGCIWDEDKRENTKWELKKNPIVIERAVFYKIRAELDQKQYDFMDDKDYDEGVRFGLMLAYQIIGKYRESEEE